MCMYMYIITTLFINHVSPFNRLPDMPILSFSDSAANKDMMPNMWTNGDTII